MSVKTVDREASRFFCSSFLLAAQCSSSKTVIKHKTWPADSGGSFC